jgi:predicted phosphate transport protein (TIGR00153 family)
MKLDRFFQLFVVKERKFFPLYIAQANNILTGAQTLLKLVKESDSDQKRVYFKEIKQIESKGDQITLQIYNELRATFVTPFDREDVNTLASKMDTFLDFIHDSARRIILYQPQKIDKHLIDIAEYIAEDAVILCGVMEELAQMRKKVKFLMQKCARIKEIEHIIDDIYESYLINVFENEKDAIELVKSKNIVQSLEDTTDRAKDISDTIKTILLKSA